MVHHSLIFFGASPDARVLISGGPSISSIFCLSIYKFLIHSLTCIHFPVFLVLCVPLPANVGDTGDAGSISGLGRSPGGGHGNPLQYSCLENPMDRGSWWATVIGSQRVRHDWSNLACMLPRKLFFQLILLDRPLLIFQEKIWLSLSSLCRLPQTELISLSFLGSHSSIAYISEQRCLRADSQICEQIFVRKFPREARKVVGERQRAGRGGNQVSMQSQNYTEGGFFPIMQANLLTL